MTAKFENAELLISHIFIFPKLFIQPPKNEVGIFGENHVIHIPHNRETATLQKAFNAGRYEIMFSVKMYPGCNSAPVHWAGVLRRPPIAFGLTLPLSYMLIQ